MSGRGGDSLLAPQYGGRPYHQGPPHTSSDTECTLQGGQGAALQPGVISCHLLLPLPPPHCTIVRQKPGRRQDLRDEKQQLSLSTTSGLVFPTEVSISAPPLRPTSGELSRLRTSCGFLSIQQTFPEHTLPATQPVGDSDFASKGEGGNLVIRQLQGQSQAAQREPF